MAELRNDVLTWRRALQILFGDREPSSDAPFRPGSDVCESLAEHFGFGDYSGLDEWRRVPPAVADLEILLAGLEVDSLEQLRFLVDAGKTMVARGPVMVV